MYKYVPLSLSMRDSIIYMDVVAKASAPKIAFLITDLDSETASANLYIENDGNLVYNSCTREGELFVYTPTVNSFPKVGLSKCQLQVVIDGRVAYSFVIFANVRENIVNDSAIEAQDEFGALEEAIRTVGQYDSRIQKNTNDITDLKNRTQKISYNGGSTVIGNGVQISNEGEITSDLQEHIFGETEVRFGDSTTDRVSIWGNAVNCVGLAITNNVDGHQYAIVGQGTRIRFYDYTDPNNILVLWDIYPRKKLTKSVTGTTNANGNLNLGLNSSYNVIGVDLGSDRYAIPFLYNGNWWAKILRDSPSFSAIVTTSVTVTVHYESIQ